MGRYNTRPYSRRATTHTFSVQAHFAGVCVHACTAGVFMQQLQLWRSRWDYTLRAMRCILAASLLLVFGALAVTIPQEVHNLGDDSESLVEMEAREGRFREFTRCTLCRHFLHPAP